MTDKRVNIGTSNLSWDYFVATAGASFNSDHKGLRDITKAIFDRDWDSEYATFLSGSFSTSGGDGSGGGGGSSSSEFHFDLPDDPLVS